ncbi:MAG: zinc ribbon domain-containing protein [Ktedonobacteraceae bacterium]|nr:zinc ribbon domain-containing protein [Ktedonobacteraceae bacterium]
MSPSTTPSCTNCGSAVPVAMRFCPNCGTPAHTGSGRSVNSTPIQIVPASPQAYPQQQPPQPVYQQAQGQPNYPSPLQMVQPPPAYAQPQKKAGGCMPAGKKVDMGSYKDGTGPAQKGNQTTWIDFPASTGLNDLHR